jgi:uncharacterized repeat protein (TIGR03803 family)
MKNSFAARLPLLAVLLLAATSIQLQAQTLTVLYVYPQTNTGNTGILAPGLMSQGQDGELYTTDASNGATNFGTLFKMTTSGQLTTLYTFCSQSGCTDGQFPYGGATLGFDGALHGTTHSGGTSGAGTVFKITPAGKITTQWSFDNLNDDSVPLYPLLQGQDGNYYGVSVGEYNGQYGAFFKVTAAGVLTTLADFDFTNGDLPNLPAQGTDGNFYGTTELGGSLDEGVIYKITPSGAITVLHNFTGYPGDGNVPVGQLVQANDGNFYGVTYKGGTYNQGTIFRITAKGVYTLLHSFQYVSPVLDGAFPFAGLILGSDNNLYGTTSQGGTHGNFGTIYKITTAGTETVVYNFCAVAGCADGFSLQVPLAQHTNGKFYGSTTGNSLGGSVFYQLDTGLGPFANLVNWKNKVGKSIGILGQGFTGTTSVSFNGTSATFKVVSDTYLTATVPSGATQGFVTVATPGGALKSTRKFIVVPALLSFSPTSGTVGTSVILTGTSFTGASAVAFGGVKATTFTVNSDTQITATVPTGALTGKIQVITPGGTATSATSFTVTP